MSEREPQIAVNGVAAKLGRFPASTGTPLYYEWWMPTACKAILVVVHGLAEHSGRYGPFIRHMVAQGFGVAIYDQRGHGQSHGEPGHVEQFQDWLTDLAQFIQFTKEAHPGVPVVLLGHSLGGQIALNFVVRYSKGLRGVIACAPNVALKWKIPRWQHAIATLLYRYVPRWRHKHRITGAELTNDPELGAQFDADPRVCRAVTLHLLGEVQRNQNLVMALATRIHLPILMLHGNADPICDPEGTRRFFRAVPVSCKRLKLYDHCFHELFSEVNRTDIYCDVVTWLDELVLDERAGAVRAADAASASADPDPTRTFSMSRGERWAGY